MKTYALLSLLLVTLVGCGDSSSGNGDPVLSTEALEVQPVEPMGINLFRSSESYELSLNLYNPAADDAGLVIGTEDVIVPFVKIQGSFLRFDNSRFTVLANCLTDLVSEQACTTPTGVIVEKSTGAVTEFRSSDPEPRYEIQSSTMSLGKLLKQDKVNVSIDKVLRNGKVVASTINMFQQDPYVSIFCTRDIRPHNDTGYCRIKADEESWLDIWDDWFGGDEEELNVTEEFQNVTYLQGEFGEHIFVNDDLDFKLRIWE